MSKEIQREVEHIYAQNAVNEDRLKALRKLCKHEKTHEGKYSWRVGAVHNAEICSDCGHVVRYLDVFDMGNVTHVTTNGF